MSDVKRKFREYDEYYSSCDGIKYNQRKVDQRSYENTVSDRIGMKKYTVNKNQCYCKHKIEKFKLVLFSHLLPKQTRKQIHRIYCDKLNILVILSRKIDFDKSEYKQSRWYEPENYFYYYRYCHNISHLFLYSNNLMC